MILGVDRKSQRRDRVQDGLRQCLRALRGSGSRFAAVRLRGSKRFGELAQTLVDFFKRLRPGREKPLQRHAKIRFENVALPFFRFVGIEMIGGGDGVAALMLRKIHRSVGHLDQFLRR